MAVVLIYFGMKAVLVLGLVLVVHSLTYEELNACNNLCTIDEMKTNCLFNPNNQSNSFPRNVDCAMDVQKRNICMGYYGCKVDLNNN